MFDTAAGPRAVAFGGESVLSEGPPIGCVGRISLAGAIRPGRTGEVLVHVRGGVEAYLARDADGGAIASDEEVVVVDQVAPRTVLVTRLPTALPTESESSP